MASLLYDQEWHSGLELAGSLIPVINPEELSRQWEKTVRRKYMTFDGPTKKPISEQIIVGARLYVGKRMVPIVKNGMILKRKGQSGMEYKAADRLLEFWSVEKKS